MLGPISVAGDMLEVQASYYHHHSAWDRIPEPTWWKHYFVLFWLIVKLIVSLIVRVQIVVQIKVRMYVRDYSAIELPKEGVISNTSSHPPNSSRTNV